MAYPDFTLYLTWLSGAATGFLIRHYLPRLIGYIAFNWTRRHGQSS